MIVLFAPLFIFLLLIITIVLAVFKRWKFAGLTVIALLSVNIYCETFPINILRPTSSSHFLTIATYNMHSQSEYMDKNRDCPITLIKMLRDVDADIIAIQEYDSMRCKVMRDSLLKQYGYFCYSHEANSYGQNALFSKCKILKTSYVDGNPLLMCCEIDTGRGHLAVVNCHLTSNNIGEKIINQNGNPMWKKNIPEYVSCVIKSQNRRKVEAGKIKEITSSYIEKGVPVIVCGDFNDVGGSAPLRILCNDRYQMKDAWWNAGRGIGLTYNDYKWLHFRLDHILYSRHLKAIKCSVIKQNVSDHEILVADLRSDV